MAFVSGHFPAHTLSYPHQTVNSCVLIRAPFYSTSRSSKTATPSRCFVSCNANTSPEQRNQHESNTSDVKAQGTEKRNEVGAFLRFGNTVARLFALFIVFLFVDIVTGLMVLSIGSLYAIAILFEVPRVETLWPKTQNLIQRAFNILIYNLTRTYKTIRRTVRERLTD